ncbi:hypothetical protein KMZ32_13290 [Phycicoccus sp. MAQZ13P-2]|uniref:hypothetical protein n=1 Tax=Phycicoccus mangrovi TaxID=2840470 RepID=UPI001C00885A|nr:hypothetical protein [Phycicoccus mangrovi]MBT9256802.1 hypothetical protein [Phycicoccus mangrovi]MBT9275049.1 hypothetical protein [Phycicoccus mangrovi]
MADWNAVIGYMRSNYKVAEEYRDGLGEVDGLRLLFDVGNLRSQLVYLWHQTLQQGEEHWVKISSPFAKASETDLHSVMRSAGEMVCGGVAAVGDLLVVSHTAPLANLDINELERPLMLVLHSADRLEQEFGSGDTF